MAFFTPSVISILTPFRKKPKRQLKPIRSGSCEKLHFNVLHRTAYELTSIFDHTNTNNFFSSPIFLFYNG